MSEPAFPTLESAILANEFPEVDLQLRRGRHVGRDDGALYEYLLDAQHHLEPFYERFGCALVHQADGYFYLRPAGDRMGRRQLSVGEMLVGQTLALLFLDPASLADSGLIERTLVLERLEGLLGKEALMRAFHPRRRYAERIAAESVRTEVTEALRRLAELGFVELIDATVLRLRSSLMRFAEPVRGLTDPSAHLARLVAQGDVVMGEPTATDASHDDTSDPERETQEPEVEGQATNAGKAALNPNEREGQ